MKAHRLPHHNQMFDIIITCFDYDIKKLIKYEKIVGFWSHLDQACGQGNGTLILRAGFTNRLGRLKPRASENKVPRHEQRRPSFYQDPFFGNRPSKTFIGLNVETRAYLGGSIVP